MYESLFETSINKGWNSIYFELYLCSWACDVSPTHSHIVAGLNQAKPQAQHNHQQAAHKDHIAKIDFQELISGNENLINCLKCSLAKALSVLPAYLLVQKDHFASVHRSLFTSSFTCPACVGIKVCTYGTVPGTYSP